MYDTPDETHTGLSHDLPLGLPTTGSRPLTQEKP